MSDHNIVYVFLDSLFTEAKVNYFKLRKFSLPKKPSTEDSNHNNHVFINGSGALSFTLKNQNIKMHNLL